MSKLWAGRSSGEINKEADDFNSSISVDSRMYKQDIAGSIAHAKMLAKQNIIPASDSEKIVSSLEEILSDIESGKLEIDMTAEDIHTFIEGELTSRIGDAGKKLHTARSRNDQVALDFRLYLRGECENIVSLLKKVISSVVCQAEKNKDAVMPGYTHLQRAQPIVFAHHLLAYAQMFVRDIGRIEDAAKRMNSSPIGACALAGTTYPTDRRYEASLLGFSDVMQNSMDAVSDRDFAVEIMNACSLIMTHLSRFCEEIILWSSWEFSFVELSDAFTTGSSIMPQKKNSDMAELIRGKTGRVYGDQFSLLTVLKGLPLAYNKDMQEDKEPVFDSIDTVKKCLSIFSPMIETMTVKKENMYAAAKKGFINATDLADYLTKKGVPFRTAYKAVGAIVSDCIKTGDTLDTLPLEKYKEYDPLFGEDIYEEISLETCVKKRISEGGTGPGSVEQQIGKIKKIIE